MNSEYPVIAIFAEEDVLAEQNAFVALNAELAKQWPTIADEKDCLTTAE